MAHDMVQKRVDARRQKVQYPGNVRQIGVDLEEKLVIRVGDRTVHGHQPLCVERCPAEEKRRHHRHCKTNGNHQENSI